MSTADCAADLESRGLQLCQRIQSLEALPGASRLRSRVESELVDLSVTASASRLAGAANNLAAIEWELDVCAWAPTTVALAQTVQGPSRGRAHSGRPITVDVVSAGGTWWLEAKASLPFGLGSTAFVDLTQQLQRLCIAARSNLAGIHRPRVIVVFRHACPPEVAAAITSLGATPVCANREGILPDPATIASSTIGMTGVSLLQPPPLLLDVSSLLCLVSSSCRVPADDPRLRTWAAANEHWSRSLEEQHSTPLLAELRPLLERHRPWLVRRTDRSRCDALMEMAAGAAEHARWQALRTLIVTLDAPSDSPMSAAGSVGGTDSGKLCPANSCGGVESERGAAQEAIARGALHEGRCALHKSLSSLSAPHRALILDAADADALLCTANGRLVRRVLESVFVRAHVHQARWLVGDAVPLCQSEATALKQDPEPVILWGMPVRDEKC